MTRDQARGARGPAPLPADGIRGIDTTDQRSSAGERLALGAILAIGGALRLAFSTSISGNDDLSVADCALTLLDHGAGLPTGHYCARFGMVLPMAAIFGAFGTGVVQISLLPGLASLANMVLAWRLGRLLFGPAAGVAAAAVMASFPMAIEYAGLAFPDAIQGALLAGALLCVLLAARGEGGRGEGGSWGLPILGGVLWAWGHYVKLDAVMLAPVLGLAWLLGLARLRDVIVTGLVAFALVGIELVAYAVLAGDALLRVQMESRAANEVLAAGQDYRNWFIYPKSMFVVPYGAGLFYFLWVASAGVALWTRRRAALLVLGWSAVWMLWLMFGADPFSGLRLKPQVPRYLLAFAIPVAILGGWFCTLLWQSARLLCLALAGAIAATTLVFAPFNVLAYEAARATRLGVAAAQRAGWFPLCPDAQSASIAHFLLHGRPEGGRICVVQEHNYLTGVTTLHPPQLSPAWVLLNENFARRLETRSLVRRVDPAGFGRTATLVWQVDNPMPALSYTALELLLRASALLPVASLRAGIAHTASDLTEGGDARIWQVEAGSGSAR